MPNGPDADRAAESEAPLLRMRGIRKRYGGVEALTGVDLDLHAGEVHAVVGENGAGKSTVVKILAGLVQPDAGTIELAGEPLDASRRHADRHDIAVVYQELTVVPDLSVLENVFLGNVPRRFVYRRKPLRDAARRALEVVGLESEDLDRRAGELSVAERQLIEIARAMARDARVIVLDEPTATLSDAEIERVFATVNRLRDEGRTIVYITHRLNEVFTLAERVTTLRNGARVATDDIGELDPQLLVRKMIGRAAPTQAPGDGQPPTTAGSARTRLKASGLSSPGWFEDVSFEAAPGEVVGLIGQIGSGAGHVVRALAGLVPDLSGEVQIDGEPAFPDSPRVAMENGVAFVSDDRAAEGLFLLTRVNTNLTASVLDQVSVSGVLMPGRERRLGLELAEQFKIDVGRLGSPVSALSGGNQQKVSLAKAVAVAPRVLLMTEPTRGVDVGARAEIYAHLRRLREGGMSVVMFTSDTVEALAVCDRIIAMFRGRVVSDRPRGECSDEILLRDITHPETSPAEASR